MKVCEDCNKVNLSRYLNKCNNCYKKSRKVFKKPKSNCLSCGKSCVKVWDRIKDLCHACYHREKIKNDPDYHEKYKKYQRDRLRIKRGIDVNLPLLMAPAGSGSIKKGQGYRVICKKEYRGHPHADKKGRIAEHTLIMCKHIGRSLNKGETVHHINGIRDDNRIENLELWSSSHPPGQRIEDKIKWCKEFLSQYGYKIIKDVN